MAKKLKTYEVLVKALNNFSLVNLDINVFNKKGENVFKKIKEAEAKAKILYDTYLSFIEENGEPFTLKNSNSSKNWDGVLEYSTNTQDWSEWDGTEVSSSNNGKLYLRGTGNSKITGGSGRQFVLTNNKRIQCLGNIENLLDYETVKAGNHPIMAEGCYKFLFTTCASLTTAPDFPATALTNNCYESLFNSCTSLTTAPELPAMTLANYCYFNMFRYCTSLTTVHDFPATILADRCYQGIFNRCTALTGTIHCPASTTNNSNRLDAMAQIPAGTATVVYDL